MLGTSTRMKHKFLIYEYKDRAKWYICFFTI